MIFRFILTDQRANDVRTECAWKSKEWNQLLNSCIKINASRIMKPLKNANYKICTDEHSYWCVFVVCAD